LAGWVLVLALMSTGGYGLLYLTNTAFVHATFLVFWWCASFYQFGISCL